MTDQNPDDYLRRLERGLKGLPRSERGRIVKEIRGHIEDRGPQSMSGLGDATVLAHSFVEDYASARQAALGGDDADRGQLAGLLHLTKAGFGLMLFVVAGAVSAVLYLIGLLGLVIGIGKLVAPRHVGVWFHKGEISSKIDSNQAYIVPPGSTDLGFWLAPIGLALAVACVFLSTAILIIAARRLLIRPLFDAFRLRRRHTLGITRSPS